jgi:hypothetical protein
MGRGVASYLLLSLASLAQLFIQLSQADSQCYFTSNTEGVTTNYEPCVADLPGGQHTSCCLIQNGDVCMSTGLCMFVNQTFAPGMFFFWANGCTDPTGKDPACQQWCPSTLALLQA